MREVYRNVIRDLGRRKLEVMRNHGEENSGLALAIDTTMVGDNSTQCSVNEGN